MTMNREDIQSIAETIYNDTGNVDRELAALQVLATLELADAVRSTATPPVVATVEIAGALGADDSRRVIEKLRRGLR